jgi:peptidyl-dipeptidase Dcp
MASARSHHPLLDPSDLPYQLPRFADIAVSDYAPAIRTAMARQQEAIAAICADPEPPSFANTLEALERSGVTLRRALAIFGNLASADATPEIDAIDAELAPQLAAHSDAILLNATLFARIEAVAAGGEELDPEAAYLLERTLCAFRLAGAGLNDADKARLSVINGRLSELSTAFKVNLQADSNDLAVRFDSAEELNGLSAGELSAARQAAEDRGHPGAYLVSLVLPTAHPYLSTLTDAGARARLSAAQRARGCRGNAHDTRAIALEIVALRAERAQLLGFANHAAAVTSDRIAKTPEAVMAMLTRLAAPAAANAAAEQARLERRAGAPITAADWPYWAERVRAADYAVDLAALRPYFEAERVLQQGVFASASALYGLHFRERPDLAGYHPDVRTFEVMEEDGTPVGLYLLDLYARETKRGGAWMNSLVDAASLTGTVTAVVVNNLNVPKPAPGEPTLLTFEQARTLFHEFGHALHGLLGRSRYPELSGTSVPSDWVEFPSQANEMWLLWPDTLAAFAVHHETGEPIPAEVVARLRAAETFNEGFATSEYLAAAILDMAWHQLTPEQVPAGVEAIAAFEAEALAAVGLDNPAIPPRYGTSTFAHIFAGGYGAGYYSYIWAEVYDADTEQWFIEQGGRTRANGELYRRHVLGLGGTREPLGAYQSWRGRPAPIEPLLARRGLAGTAHGPAT